MELSEMGLKRKLKSTEKDRVTRKLRSMENRKARED
jgi:hypothetical protein